MPSMKDISGQRFGMLVAVRPTGERRNRSVVWECNCDCGKTTFVLSDNLRGGKTTSCGCARMGKTAVDLAGQRFGQLVVVRPTSERRNGSVVWECTCDCGKTTFANTNNLRSGNTTSCGCSRIGKKTVDLTGQRFGKLIAVRPTGEVKNGNAVWECKCDCGETTFVNTTNLRSGNSASCGCTRRTDITGQRFGRLMAIRPTDERKRGSILWECKCECGNTKFVPANQLRAGIVKSCGCLKSGKAQDAVH